MAEDGDDMVGLDTELLAQLEEEAANRYTEEDTQFMEHCSKALPKPPILPAERFDRNRQRRGNFRHQDHRRGGNFRDHRREYSDHRQGRFGGSHRDRDDDRRDYGKRYRPERENNEYGRRDYEPSKHHHAGSSY